MVMIYDSRSFAFVSFFFNFLLFLLVLLFCVQFVYKV